MATLSHVKVSIINNYDVNRNRTIAEQPSNIFLCGFLLKSISYHNREQGIISTSIDDVYIYKTEFFVQTIKSVFRFEERKIKQQYKK